MDKATHVVHVNGELWGSMQFYLDAHVHGFTVQNTRTKAEGDLHFVTADVTCNGFKWHVDVQCEDSLHSFFMMSSPAGSTRTGSYRNQQVTLDLLLMDSTPGVSTPPASTGARPSP